MYKTKLEKLLFVEKLNFLFDFENLNIWYRRDSEQLFFIYIMAGYYYIVKNWKKKKNLRAYSNHYKKQKISNQYRSCNWSFNI